MRFSRSSPPHSRQQANTTLDKKPPHSSLNSGQIRRATRARWRWTLISSLCSVLAIIFLIVAESGNVTKSHGSSDIYFISLDLSDVVPQSFPNGQLLNSIAQTLGLHDYYTVGLWGYCEGYVNSGIDRCSSPRTFYWFNPVEIIQSQLLAGASIQLPQDITRVLKIIRIASHVMSGFFLAGACLSFVLAFLKPLMVTSRWTAFAISLLSFLNAALIFIASTVATVMFVIMRNVFDNADQVNINAKLGNKMLAMIWIATAFAVFSWLIDLSLCCCCASRRDVKKGKKRGSKEAYALESAEKA